jgi:hypothetical protein
MIDGGEKGSGLWLCFADDCKRLMYLIEVVPYASNCLDALFKVRKSLAHKALGEFVGMGNSEVGFLYFFEAGWGGRYMAVWLAMIWL